MADTEGARLVLVVFDGDDTLWKTQELYDAAKRHFAHMVKFDGLSNIPNDDLIREFDLLDADRVRSHGFTAERFLGSMELMYRDLCRAAGRQPAEEQIELLRQKTAAELARTEVYEDAEQALALLGSDGHRLVLLTKGEPQVQERRIAESGLARHFGAVYIVPVKTVEEFRHVLKNQNTAPEEACSVGNSARSDILPAQEAGMRGVLIPRGQWRYEEVASLPNAIAIVNTLSEAAEQILRMDKFSQRR